MRRFSSRSLNSLQGVHPDLVRVVCRALVDGRLDFVVIEGLRSLATQKRYVAQGASRTMNSRHLYGLAVDVVPINPENKRAEFNWELYALLAPDFKAAAEKEQVAIIWGGDWTTFKDGPQFELPFGLYPNGVKFQPIDPARYVDNIYASKGEIA